MDCYPLAWVLNNLEFVHMAVEALEPARLRALPVLGDLLGLCAVVLLEGRADEAIRFADEAISLAREGRARTRWSLPWFLKGMALAETGRIVECLAVLEEGMRQPGDRLMLWCRTLHAVYQDTTAAVAPAEALRRIDEAVADVTAAGIPGQVAWALYMRAVVLRNAQRLKEAIRDEEDAATMAESAGLRYVAALSRRDLGVTLVHGRDFARALPLLLESLEWARSSGDQLMAQYTLAMAGAVLAERDHPASTALLVEGYLRWGQTVSAADRELLRDATARARAALGGAEFDRLAARGAAMPFLDLLRYAESELRSAIAEFEGRGDRSE